MDKWDYINEISKRGDRYGNNSGLADLLRYTGKENTQEITKKEAKEFFENVHLQ